MENILPCLLRTTDQHPSRVHGDNHIILTDYFYPNNDGSDDQRLSVSFTNSAIWITSEIKDADKALPKTRRICHIDFDLKFELLRGIPNCDNAKTALGIPYGIRFDKIGFQPFSIYNSEEVVINWKNHLEKKINRRGFHNLFKPIKKIGKGNFASVYLAERLEDKKMVAVKAFSKEATFSQQKGKESLINEINLLRKLDQKNVLKLHAVYESQNSIYMTMELLQGQQLFSKIQSKHRFTSQETRQIMEGLLKGLEHMHSERIMHRDLKPQNIMLRQGESCEAVIVDFGLATWADEPTYLFVRCGTPGYVAPEIINIKDMSTKSQPVCDIFSIGLIFHILLMGKSVFPGKTYNEVLTQNRACDFYLDSAAYKVLPSEVLTLLKRMLQRSPTDRITAAEALNHPYFSGMDIEEPLQTKLPFSPLVGVNQNDSNYPRLQNKVSICSNVSELNSFQYGLKHSLSIGANKENQLQPFRRQFSCKKENVY